MSRAVGLTVCVWKDSSVITLVQHRRRFRQPSVRSRWLTLAQTEGPTVDADGNVYFMDLRRNRIMRLSTDGELSTFRQQRHNANGLIFDSEWRLLACERGDGVSVPPRVTRTNMKTGKVEVVADHYEGKQLHSPNDLTIDG